MKIVVSEFEDISANVFDDLRQHHDVIVIPYPIKSDRIDDIADVEILSPFIYSRLDESCLNQLPQLKCIATRSTGFDHIEMDICRKRGITVSNVPTYGESTVAEHTFALLLALTHRLPEAVERARKGAFTPRGLEGVDLAGKTIGVIGTGNIGRHVVRIANGFGMRVLAYDIAPDYDFAESVGLSYVQFEDLLQHSDFITLHVPATAKTHNMLDKKAIALMKDGVFIINTARGDLIELEALLTALKSNKVAGAGLDVLPDEPLIREEAELVSSIFSQKYDLRNLVAEHLLLHMPNVIITPHSAFATREAMHRIIEVTLQNIHAFLDGDPKNCV